MRPVVPGALDGGRLCSADLGLGVVVSGERAGRHSPEALAILSLSDHARHRMSNPNTRTVLGPPEGRGGDDQPPGRLLSQAWACHVRPARAARPLTVSRIGANGGRCDGNMGAGRREACRDTLAQYTHSGDRFLLEQLAEAFCEDGVLEVRGDDPVVGRKAIIERLARGRGSSNEEVRAAAKAEQSAGTRRTVRHNVANIRFEAMAPTEATVS